MAAGGKPGTGPAERGSRLQLQLYVARHAGDLQDAINKQVPALAEAAIDWISPLPDGQPSPFWEYQDAAFLRALDLGEHVDALRKFWPARGGPQWDGLALLSWPDGRRGELLLEAKANVPELLGNKSTCCRAKAEKSRRKINQALAETRRALGASGSAAAWTGPLYQTANRLAHLHFLRAHAGRDQAWFVHLLFVNDPTYKRTTCQQWEDALRQVNRQLGLPARLPHAAHVFVDGLDKPADWPA